MTESLFYTPELTGATVQQLVSLDTATSGHAVRSQRLGAGDKVLISDGLGTLAEGVLENANPQHATIRIQAVAVAPRHEIQVNLVQALAKGERDLLAAEMATEVGIDSVTPWQARRSIVRLRPERAQKTLAKWEAKLKASAQQARRAFIPTLAEPIIAEEIATLHSPQNGNYVIVLHEDGEANLGDVVDSLPGVKTLHLVVGPEGGVSPEELNAVLAAGGSAVKIGSHVMRASTAGPVAVALVNQLCNRW